MDREVKRLKRSRIPLIKVRWNSKRGPEFTWEREDQFKKKYPHLFTKTAPSSSAASLHLTIYVKHYLRYTCYSLAQVTGICGGMSMNRSIGIDIPFLGDLLSLENKRYHVRIGCCGFKTSSGQCRPFLVFISVEASVS
ncbi:hypothetical protein Tco_0060418 [Tanacetum coccineum]